MAGVNVTPMTLPEIIQAVTLHIAGGSACVIAHINLHGLYVHRSDEGFRELTGKSFVFIDGMPIVWLARLLGHPLTGRYRVTYVDLIWPLLERAAAEDWRVFYLGGDPQVLARGLAKIKARFPKLQLSGHDGFFDTAEKTLSYLNAGDDVVDEINRFAPHLLLVGMGMPKQENWVLRNRQRLTAPVVMTAGACIEYLAGAASTPPRWMGRCGLEWFYRLYRNPRRFWRRYLIEPWIVIGHLAGRIFG